MEGNKYLLSLEEGESMLDMMGRSGTLGLWIFGSP